MSAFSVENPHDGKTFENYTRFEWGVEVGVVTTFMLRLFVPHEFDMIMGHQSKLKEAYVALYSKVVQHFVFCLFFCFVCLFVFLF